MGRNKRLMLICGVILLVCFLLIIRNYSISKQTEQLDKLRSTTESYLIQQYPEYNMQISEFKYNRHNHGGYYSGTAKGSNNLNYEFVLNSDGGINHVLLRDESIIKGLTSIVETEAKKDFHNIKEINVDTSILPIPQGVPSSHKIVINLSLTGFQMTPEEVAQKFVLIRDALIIKTQDKYIIQNMNMQYSYLVNEGYRNINIGVDSESLNYPVEKILKRMWSN